MNTQAHMPVGIQTRTKIICTIGPAVNSLEKILCLIEAGMSVARLNFSHGSHREQLEMIELLKKAREMAKVPLAIMLDTKGPEIRLGKIKEDQISLMPQQRILLVPHVVEGDKTQISIFPGEVLTNIEVGMQMLFDDGYIISQVVEKTPDGILIEIQNEGVLKSHKGVNVPGAHLDLPAMTEQDIADITFGCEQDVDMIAASFIRSAEHVLEIKKLLREQEKPEILVIAKIENSLGVRNFDSIVQVADGIMVARGDLGVELPLRQVPGLQKMMISKCYQAGKSVVTATQMLESMIHSPRPTRAEVSDVANAIYDSTSAVMLSGETALGKYPIETVCMMREIIQETESNFAYREFFYTKARNEYNDVSSSVALATVKTAYSADAKAIFAFTNSGFTARWISQFRPEMPIIALTSREKVYHQLASSWGVIPIEPVKAQDFQQAFTLASEFALKRGLLKEGDLVVVTSGSPFGVSGTTNMMVVKSIGDVLVRGFARRGKKVQGQVALVLSSNTHRRKDTRDCLVVIPCCDDSYLPFLEGAKGIILQNHPNDKDSEKHAIQVGKALDIPLLLRADGALSLLQEGQWVILDPQKGIVQRGNPEES